MFCALLLQCLTLVSLNVENLFDCEHDTLKNDLEWLPDGDNHWNKKRYWKKVNHLAQEVIACGETEEGWELPDLVALCEVENDTVMRDLTRRSPLRNARYEYVMTDSPDPRGIDVALMYSPFSFSFIESRSFGVKPLKGMHAPRDILFVKGRLLRGDTLCVFVVHAPSRTGGERATRNHRLIVAQRLCELVDSVRLASPQTLFMVAGDFNDTTDSPSLLMLQDHGLHDVSMNAKGKHGAKGTYRYRGEWGSLDHIFVSDNLMKCLSDCQVFDAPFLLEKDEKYGGMKPHRTYLGPRYVGGYSDHLPLVARFCLGNR